MKSRVYTAVILVAATLASIYLSEYTFVLLFGGIAGLCLWELLGLVLPNEKKRDLSRRVMGLLLGLTPYIAMGLIQLGFAPLRLRAEWVLLFFPFVFLAFIFELFARSDRPFQNVAYVILGVIYIGVPFSMLEMVAFQDGRYEPNIVLGLMVLNWVNDTAAYLVGSRQGKTPLLPRISPKKTWEGSMGGAIFTLLTCMGLAVLMPQRCCVDWAVLAVIIIIFGTLGDLVESMLKRSVQTKDSGSLLPGHGGLLDRFDSFLFMLPFATIYLLWVR
ncbi:MAG TPA: phosphatidate cytidylyltransferase [Saprospiraceae bacterium]|nr:phosphatidate cytidylyltransferase [Saprospiraceae bacterium]HMP22933.1 phosphatidate cytidylyltransferase [Saprospiraceae bacterium]